MPDTPFKSMTPETPRVRTNNDRILRALATTHYKRVACDKCGGNVRTGDWPWCRGNPEDHRRDA